MPFRFPFAPVFAISEELIPLLLIVAIVFLVVMALRSGWSRGSGSGRSRHGSATGERDAETEVLARMLDQLDRMERRMQNLETIIMDKDKETGRKDREDRR